MYTVISIYAGSRVGGVGASTLNCHPKATNKEQNILTKGHYACGGGVRCCGGWRAAVDRKCM